MFHISVLNTELSEYAQLTRYNKNAVVYLFISEQAFIMNSSKDCGILSLIPHPRPCSHHIVNCLHKTSAANQITQE